MFTFSLGFLIGMMATVLVAEIIGRLFDDEDDDDDFPNPYDVQSACVFDEDLVEDDDDFPNPYEIG